MLHPNCKKNPVWIIISKQEQKLIIVDLAIILFVPLESLWQGTAIMQGCSIPCTIEQKLSIPPSTLFLV